MIMRLAVATKSSSVASSMKLSNISNWMGDHQGTLGAVSRFPFVGVDRDLGPTVLNTRIRGKKTGRGRRGESNVTISCLKVPAMG